MLEAIPDRFGQGFFFDAMTCRAEEISERIRVPKAVKRVFDDTEHELDGIELRTVRGDEQS